MRWQFPLVFIGAFFFSNSLAAQDSKIIHVYLWDTYISPTLFEQFEKTSGIKVLADVFDNNDALLADLRSGKSYDVIAPSGNYLPQMIAEGLVAPLPDNLKALGGRMIPELQNPPYDPDSIYSLPLFYGTTGLAANTKLLDKKIESWRQYFTPEAGLKGKIGQLDELSSVINVVYLALNMPPCADTSEAYQAIENLFNAQKPFVKNYSTTGYMERLAAGEVVLQLAFNGDIFKIRQDNPDIKFIYPKEGVELWADNLSIPATAKNPQGAAQFIDFLFRPENLALYSEEAGFMPGLAAAQNLMPENIKNAPEFKFPPSSRVVITSSCPTHVIQTYEKIWERLVE